MSNLVKDDNLDDDGNWVVNFRISIEDVRIYINMPIFIINMLKILV